MVFPSKVAGYVKEMRARPTRAEAHLLLHLMILCRRHNISLTFQQPLRLSNNRWSIIDFLLGGKIAVELDGAHHLEDPIQRSRDRDRDARIEYEYQIRVLRIPNSKVTDNSLEVGLDLVDMVLKERGEERRMSRYELEAEIQKIIFRRMGLGYLESL